MSEQNEVVIRKVHDGYLVELLDCPLAYTFSSQDEAERFIGPVWQRLDYVKDLHSQALRAENARLRKEYTKLFGLAEPIAKMLTELKIIPIGCSREQELAWKMAVKNFRHYQRDFESDVLLQADLQPERGNSQ